MFTATFFGWLKLEYINGRQWKVIGQQTPEAFGVMLNDGRKIIPPEGFVTDFASIPRAFWRILPPTGDGARARYGICAVLHDYLYATGKVGYCPVPRIDADDIFRACMLAVGVSRWRVAVIYWAVRLFAGFAWKGDRCGA